MTLAEMTEGRKVLFGLSFRTPSLSWWGRHSGVLSPWQWELAAGNVHKRVA